MTTEDKVNSPNVIEQSFNIQSAYSVESPDLKIKVDSIDYSNLAYIQISYRDVMVDFLKMPGVKGDNGENIVEAKRIFMSHAAAKNLAVTIIRTLENAYNSGQLEQYTNSEQKE